MFLKKGLKILSYILLVAFISLKASGLHVIAHHDDGQQAEHCMWCDVAVESTQQPSLLQFFDFNISIPGYQELIPKPFTPQISLASFHVDGTLFSRPPPVL